MNWAKVTEVTIEDELSYLVWRSDGTSQIVGGWVIKSAMANRRPGSVIEYVVEITPPVGGTAPVKKGIDPGRVRGGLSVDQRHIDTPRVLKS